MRTDFPKVERLTASVYEIPTEQPEADGTYAWDSTSTTVVQAFAGGECGIGWTYSGAPVKAVVEGKLAGLACGSDPMEVRATHEQMVRSVRNLGRPGVVAAAISAVDTALWDLRARLLGLALSELLGAARDEVPIYGSGGFTTYDDDTTRRQLHTWVQEWEIPRVKIKIGESWGADPGRDLHRVALTRQTVGGSVEVYVDANGAYSRKQAVRLGSRMAADYDVRWFEEPVSSDDLAGLREVRDQCAADVAAGEYGYSPSYFVPMIAAQSVDCVQADVSRCGGITDWLVVAHLCQANNLQISGHCAPNLHAHVAVTVPNLRHLEYFHDHARIESLLFDGVLDPVGGSLVPDRSRPGNGLTIRESDVEQFRQG